MSNVPLRFSDDARNVPMTESPQPQLGASGGADTGLKSSGRAQPNPSSSRPIDEAWIRNYIETLWGTEDEDEARRIIDCCVGPDAIFYDINVDLPFGSAPDAEPIIHTGPDLRGPEAYLNYWKKMKTLFRDVRVVLQDFTIEPQRDKFWCRYKVEGKRRHDNHEFHLGGFVLCKLDETKIVQEWDMYDKLPLLHGFVQECKQNSNPNA
jgi:hypothetical protein